MQCTDVGICVILSVIYAFLRLFLHIAFILSYFVEIMCLSIGSHVAFAYLAPLLSLSYVNIHPSSLHSFPRPAVTCHPRSCFAFLSRPHSPFPCFTEVISAIIYVPCYDDFFLHLPFVSCLPRSALWNIQWQHSSRECYVTHTPLRHETFLISLVLLCLWM